MFVDASALIAMLTDEEQARLLAGRLQNASNRVTAPPCVIEAVAAVAAETGLSPERAGAVIGRFLDLMGIRSVSLPAQLAGPASAAMERFGRSAARPGGLGPGDCLVYAAARYFRMPLLFSGPAFAATDIEAG